MKNMTSKLLCAAVALVIMLSFAGCGAAKSLGEGVWYQENGDGFGYRFGELLEASDGTEMGRIERVGVSSTISLVSYHYHYTGENEITIIKRTPNLSGAPRDEVHEVMQIVEENGQKVLLCQCGHRYTYSEA